MTAAISIALAQVLPMLVAIPVIAAVLIAIHVWCRHTEPDTWPIHDPKDGTS